MLGAGQRIDESGERAAEFGSSHGAGPTPVLAAGFIADPGLMVDDDVLSAGMPPTAMNRLGRAREMPLTEPSPLPSPIQRARFGVAAAASAFNLLGNQDASRPASHRLTFSFDASTLSLYRPLPLPTDLSVLPRVNHPVRFPSPPLMLSADLYTSSGYVTLDSAMPISSPDSARTRSRSASPLLSEHLYGLSVGEGLRVSPSSSRSNSPPVVVTPPRDFRSPPGPVLALPMSSTRSAILTEDHSCRELFPAAAQRVPEPTSPRS